MSSASKPDTWHAHAGRTGRAPQLFGALAILVLLLGLGIGPATATAQEEGEEPEPTSLEIEKSGYWTNTAGTAVPDVVVESFPPQVVCLVIPQTCTETTEPVSQPVREIKKNADEDAAPTLPAQPMVFPDTLPTGRLGGQPRYTSAVQFELPPTPEGKEIASFTLQVTESQPTYSLDSPAYRQAILAVLRGIQTEDPAVTLAELQAILTNPDEYPLIDESPMRTIACPIESEWEGGENQAWDERPEIGNCILGSNGTRTVSEDGTSAVHRYDLTLAAQDIAEGEMPNNGVFLAPMAAENLAYGDKDPTDNAQVSLAGPESETPPVAIIEYRDASGSETFTLETGTASGGGSLDASGDEGSSTSTAGSGGTDTGTQTSSFGQAPSFEADEAPAAPEPAPEVAAPSQDQAPAKTQDTFAQQNVAAQPGLYWPMWMLLPIGLAGLYVLSRSLTAAPAVAAERQGAMSRLIEQRRNGGGVQAGFAPTKV